MTPSTAAALESCRGPRFRSARPADSAMLLLLFALACRSSGDDPAPELGRVAWQREHEAAFRAAKGSAKPVLILFQEVPG